MGSEFGFGKAPELEVAAKVYQRSMQRLEKYNTARTIGERELYYKEILPEVRNAVDAAVDMQEGKKSPRDELLTHQRLRMAYAEGAEALSKYEHTNELAAPLLKGYVEHTQEVVKLQSQSGNVFVSHAEVTGEQHLYFEIDENK